MKNQRRVSCTSRTRTEEAVLGDYFLCPAFCCPLVTAADISLQESDPSSFQPPLPLPLLLQPQIPALKKLSPGRDLPVINEEPEGQEGLERDNGTES